MSRLAAPLTLAAVALAALAALYAIAFGTSPGLSLDERAIPAGLAGPDIDRVEAATSTLLETISAGSLVLAGAGIVGIALLRRRPGLALAGVAIVAGANLTTQLLKPALARLDPLGGDVERFSQGGFPSGHATVAMSLALALALVVPATVRPLVAVVAGVYAAAVGVGLLLLGWHFPSDVVGGFLIAGAWTGAAVTVLRAGERRESVTVAGAPRPSRAVGAAIALAALVGLAAAAAIGSRIGDLGRVAEYGRLEGAFFASAAAIAALGIALPVVLAGAMARTARGGRL